MSESRVTAKQTLAYQVNERRIQRGKEPLTIAHIQRAIRLIAGPRPKGRNPVFRNHGTYLYRQLAGTLQRVYTRAPRGRK